jgi:hypothetical protein
MNKDLQNIAQKVLDKIDQSKEKTHGSIITILMIISIILTVIRVLQECNKNKMSNFTGENKTTYFANEIKETSIRRTWFTKMMLKKAVRKQLDKEQYKKYGMQLVNAILTTGEELKEEELITLAEAVNV